ncbi:MAG: SHOCT domain-containing protein, partial [Desulfosalsimonas sp.]
DQESESGDESVQESLEKPEHGPGEKRDEIRSRLKYLKELYEEGLITESEYESQKRQALEELQ